ncbi:hypothetical protein BKA25_004859 [Actinoalloteichus hymeniacidonis]|uniref:Uncharacterized protein n=1 Tax=Actinoalloteichus hymeniacidonis TaxID=340345 RepID=A0AAC9HLN1_9PSEU|nr:hypothetical protein TL08_03085 [Actinoalloteichus hymeniacidonis]MBB5910543.1 hypothetical protein [Actinoalloteichus hymeniacidonis]
MPDGDHSKGRNMVLRSGSCPPRSTTYPALGVRWGFGLFVEPMSGCRMIFEARSLRRLRA